MKASLTFTIRDINFKVTPATKRRAVLAFLLGKARAKKSLSVSAETSCNDVAVGVDSECPAM